MSNVTKLFWLILIITSNLAFAQGDLNQNIKPQWQNIHWTLDPAQKGFAGETTIYLEVEKPLNSILFQAKDLKLEHVTLTGSAHTFTLNVEDRGHKGLTEARIPQTISAGKYQLSMSFHGDYSLKAVGIYKTIVDNTPYLFTQFEMNDARLAFPSFDEPRFKIPYQLSITTPEKLVQMSNMPVAKQHIKDDWKTVEYQKSPPMPSYLIAFAVGPLESYEISGMDVPGKIYTVKGKKQLAETASKMIPGILKSLESYFGMPYPFPKLDLLAVPEFAYGAMENPGAVTFRDSILLTRTGNTGSMQLVRMAGVIAHEFAHMWYGDLVTMQWWDDLWLNESFATFMANKTLIELYSPLRPEMDLPQDRLMRRDALPTSRPIRKPIKSEADIADGLGLAYGKGKTVLRMIEQWIGKAAFQKAVQNYMHKYSWKNTRASDLWAEFEATSGKPVSQVLKSFLDQPGVPFISVQSDQNTLTLTQQRFDPAKAGLEQQLWSIPLIIKIGTETGTITKKILLTEQQQSIVLDQKINWAFVDGQGEGYFRWSANPALLKKLTSNAADSLEPRERAALIQNLSALTDSGDLKVVDYLQMIKNLGHDPDPMVIMALLSSLDQIEGTYIDAKMEPSYYAYVDQVIAPSVSRFGITPKNDEAESISLLRPSLLEWLGEAILNKNVIALARKNSELYLNDPSQVDPSTISSFLNISARSGDAKLFEAYIKAYEQAQSPTIRTNMLGALGYFHDTKLRHQAIRYALSDKVRATEYYMVLNGLSTNQSGKQLVLDAVLNNYDRLAKKLPESRLGQLPQYLPNLCSQKQLDQMNQFFSQAQHQTDGTLRSLAKISTEVKQCIIKREANQQSLNLFLLQYAP
ncbi:MAG: M1 family metallopeptidase [bacterium]